MTSFSESQEEEGKVPEFVKKIRNLDQSKVHFEGWVIGSDAIDLSKDVILKIIPE